MLLILIELKHFASKVVGIAGIGAMLSLLGCSTGTVDRNLFARTASETRARVQANIPPGTPLQKAQTKLKQLGWSCFLEDSRHSHMLPDGHGLKSDGTPDFAFGPVLICEAYPALGGYPLSKEYSASFLVNNGRIAAQQVGITNPTM